MVGKEHGRSLVLSIAMSMALFFVAHSNQAIGAQKIKKAPVQASGNWHARIVGSEASPPSFIAVDKKQQTLFLFERRSPLRLAGKYACTTGQAEGDKQIEGDLKTPEGVYFVTRRLASGLDYTKYGYEAYTLNYPNPVDRMRRKTGSGIWIHGRGVPITPNLTEGCVSLNNTDIAVLGKMLTPGTPVTLAEKVDFSPAPSAEDMAMITTLYKRTQEWAKAWSGRSRNFFDYYDAEAYAAAQGENFAAFRQQKERIFKAVSHIDIKIRNVQALQGPGYWVTWFEQDYRASNLSSRGVRRLYWQKNAKGELRIVGMEWEPKLAGTLTAGLNGAPIASELPVRADKTPGTAVAAAPALAAQPKAEPRLADQATSVPPAPPATPSAKPAPLAAAPSASAAKPAPAEPAVSPAETVAVALADLARKPEVAAQPAPESRPGSKAAPKARQPKLEDVAAFVEAWRKAWEKGDVAAYAGHYGKNAVQGSRTGVNAIRSHKAGLWKKSKPRSVVLTNIRITTKQDMVVVDMQQAYTDSRSFADMGVKTLYLQPEADAWRIVREDWSPM